MRIRFVLMAMLAVLVSGGPPAAGETAGELPELVRAKIGVLVSSGGKERMAKSRDRLKAGDMLRVFVHPEKAAHIYVVYSDRNEAVLLNTVSQETSGSTLVLPSVNESYEIDGASPLEGFTILVSPEPLPRVAALLGQTANHAKWSALEAELVKESRILTTEKSQIPFAIAGNVRGGIAAGPAGGAVKHLRIYSGNALVVKTYEFAVKK